MEAELSVRGAKVQERQQATATPAPRTTVIIPAYNEEEGLLAVLNRLFSSIDETYEVIVVDDGSTDATAEVAARFPCRVLSCGVNRGKGAGLRAGIGLARGENIIVIDADNTYPVEEVPQIARELAENDMVVASRVRGRHNIPALNRLGNTIFRRSIRHLYGFEAADPLTGLYGVKRAHLMRMQLDATGFGIESEIAIKGARLGLKTVEIPIEYGQRIGQAKLRGFKDGYRIFRTIFGMLALYNPTATFILPGALLFGLGIALLALLMSGPLNIGGVMLQEHSFIVATTLCLVGFQLGVFGFAMNVYSVSQKIMEPDSVTRLFLRGHMGRNISVIGLLIYAAGLGLGTWLAYQWASGDLGSFTATKPLTLSLFLLLFGLQLIFSAVFLSIFTSELRKSRGETAYSQTQAGAAWKVSPQPVGVAMASQASPRAGERGSSAPAQIHD